VTKPALPVWPEEGLPLAEALWHIEPDPQAFDLGLFSPMVAASSVCRQRVGRLCALVREGSYRIKGRRGSLTAPPEGIPASAVPYLDFARSDRSELRERILNGQRWYDVRVERGAPPIESQQVESAQPVNIPFYSYTALVTFCRHSKPRHRNWEQMDAAAVKHFGCSIPDQDRRQAHKEIGPIGKRGRPKKTRPE
jgi:hypothetical protein